MDTTIITFSAAEQVLTKTGGVNNVASDTVGYIEAHFDLDDNWSSFNSVTAYWTARGETYGTVLDSNGVCIAPTEMGLHKGPVKVNLVGSISDNDVITDRLTSFQAVAFTVTDIVQTDGSETAEVTASQFDQYVAIVADYTNRAETAATNAETSEDNAKISEDNAKESEDNAKTSETNAGTSETNAYSYMTQAIASAGSAAEDANKAEQASANAGYMFFYIDENGDLIYQRTPNTQVDFYLSNGDLYVEAIE